MKTKRDLVLLFLLSLFVFWVTSPKGDTPYNYFTLLADGALHGRYWLTDNPSWLSELIPGPSGRFYIPYPPGPAFIAMPFVLLFGPDFPQQYLGFLIGAGFVSIMYLLAKSIHNNKTFILWASLFSLFGTITWYLSSVGSSWYLGQMTAAFFLSVAILESTTKKRVWVVTLCLGMAYLCRVHTILSLPFFIYVLKDQLKVIRNTFAGASILSAFFLFNAAYNFIRFGVPWDAGYYLIPGILQEPWFSKGILHPSYIPNNIKTAFFSFPKLLKEKPFIEPSWAGLSIWITTPAFAYAGKARLKEKMNQFAWISILLIFGFVSLHGSTGFAQFGYRFAVDFYPFLFYLVFKGISGQNLKWHHRLLLFISICVNLWGVLWINKFQWVDF